MDFLFLQRTLHDINAQSGEGQSGAEGKSVAVVSVFRPCETPSCSFGCCGDEADGGVEPSDKVEDSRWYIGECSKTHLDALCCRCFKTIAESRSSPSIYGQIRVKHDACVGAW